MHKHHLEITRETAKAINDAIAAQGSVRQVLLDAMVAGMATTLLDSYVLAFQDMKVWIVEVRKLQAAPRTLNVKEWIVIHAEHCSSMVAAKAYAMMSFGVVPQWHSADAGRAAWAKINDTVEIVITPFPVRSDVDDVETLTADWAKK